MSNAPAWKCEDQNMLKAVASAGRIVSAANLLCESEGRKLFGAVADEDEVVDCARKVLLYRHHSRWCRRRDGSHTKVTVIRSFLSKQLSKQRSHGCYWLLFAEDGARATGLPTDTGVPGRRFDGNAESVTEAGAEND